MALKVPTIHLNGSNPVDLVNQNAAVAGALSKAIDTMREAMPNGRDYYPQGPEAYGQAHEERCKHIEMLTQLRDEYMALAETIVSMPGGRR